VPGVGPAEAEPVVGDHPPPRGGAEPLGKPAPELDAAEGVVKEDDGRSIAGTRRVATRAPGPREEPTPWRLDPPVVRFASGGQSAGA
jgi:hypothetical protein